MNKKQRSKVASKQIQLRESLWPDLGEAELWDRKKSKGWLTIPRVMPVVSRLMDGLSKGKPVSATYLDLWCRTYEDSFVIANKHGEMAFSAGFNGERSIKTWKGRVKTLEKLGFINIKEGPSGPISYILIYNPLKVIKELMKNQSVDTGTINALKQRMIEVGADDLDDEQ